MTLCPGCGTTLDLPGAIECMACFTAGGVNLARRWAVATARQQRIERALR